MKENELNLKELVLDHFEDIELKGFEDIKLDDFNLELKTFSFMDTRSIKNLNKSIELLRKAEPTPIVKESLQLLEEIKDLEGIE